MIDAKKHAERQYEKFNSARKLERQKEADRLIAELKTTDKALQKSKTTMTTKTVTVAGERSVV